MMKTRIFIVIAMVIFAAACEKDPLSKGPSFSDGKPGRNNGELHLPFKASFSTIPDSPVEVELIPGFTVEASMGGLIAGNATQVGKIKEDESRYHVVDLIPEETQITQLIAGKIVAANGDYYTYTGTAVISFIDGSLNGTMLFTGGTGKFEDVSGSIVITGVANPVTSDATFSGDGVIIFPK